MRGAAVEACCDTSEVLELVEAAFDCVSDLIGLEVVGDQLLSGGIAGDHRFGAHVGDQASQGIGIIGLVGKHAARRKTLEQGRGDWSIASLAGRKEKLERSTEAIHRHVNLGCQSSSGTPQSLVPPFWPPPFPVAACWWARTRLESRLT